MRDCALRLNMRKLFRFSIAPETFIEWTWNIFANFFLLSFFYTKMKRKKKWFGIWNARNWFDRCAEQHWTIVKSVVDELWLFTLWFPLLATRWSASIHDAGRTQKWNNVFCGKPIPLLFLQLEIELNETKCWTKQKIQQK